nr:glycoside hydrolase family 30 protein [Clostridium caldaquaticum]
MELTGEKQQRIDGFGGCFNELGWIALSKIDKKEKEKVISELFNTETGCKFNFCRTPIGANDYAAEWYSYNENDGDYAMEKFSIERDRSYLIPYIKEAQRFQPDLKLFASPWSPPTWMKFPKAYNNGTLRMEKEILESYALYFKKYVEAYKEEGININQVHIQNEPFADQKFPSCLWTGEQYRVFIRDYIGPLFEREGLDTEIWFGTLNGPMPMSFTLAGIKLQSYAEFVDRVLFDEDARKYIKGVGYQWAGQHVIQRTHESFPELKLMQTENECGDGTNTWEYARYIFGLIRHYFNNGVNAYVYWNMVLEPKGTSTWGWNQNSLITINPETKEVIYNPEFYVMKHFSHFVKPGAVKLGAKGHWTGSSLVFENPDGEIVIIVSNDMNMERNFTFKGKDKEFSITLKPNSFNTIVVE